jgi:hypothetical protein
MPTHFSHRAELRFVSHRPTFSEFSTKKNATACHRAFATHSSNIKISNIVTLILCSILIAIPLLYFQLDRVNQMSKTIF